jgi:hypothetical protein
MPVALGFYGTTHFLMGILMGAVMSIIRLRSRLLIAGISPMVYSMLEVRY